MSTTANTQPTGPQRTVYVRIGTHRRAYHPAVECPALIGKRQTRRGQEEMAEDKAQQQGLTLCGHCPPIPPQPVEVEFTGLPLYDVPLDHRQAPRPFTVAVAGPGRHERGELPSVFVVEAYRAEQAWAKVLAWYMVEHETVDVFVVAGESFEGTPPARQGSFWHDLRGEYARQEALDDLADQAAAVVEEFTEETRELADQSAELEAALGDAAFSAWPLVLQLAENDGR